MTPSSARRIPEIESGGQTVFRWTASGAIVLVSYAMALSLIIEQPHEGAMGALSEATLIELEPIPLEAVPLPPEPLPEPIPETTEATAREPSTVPEPQQTEPLPEGVAFPLPDSEPEEQAVLEPEPAPETMVPEIPERESETAAILDAPIPTPRPAPARLLADAARRPAERPRESSRRPEPPPKLRAERHAERTATVQSQIRASQRSSAAPRVSPARWQSQIVAKIRRSGRRLSGRPDGTAMVAFSVDRTGRVRSARLSRSSGNAELDSEAVASVRRASPMPPPPEGIESVALSMVVPVKAN